MYNKSTVAVFLDKLGTLCYSIYMHYCIGLEFQHFSPLAMNICKLLEIKSITSSHGSFPELSHIGYSTSGIIIRAAQY